MKRILSIVAVIALLVTFMVPAFADGSTVITITDAEAGEIYKAFKIFDVTNSGEAYAYTYTSTGSTLSSSSTGLDKIVYDASQANLIALARIGSTKVWNVTKGTGTTPTLAEFLRNHYEVISALTPAYTSAAAAGSPATASITVTDPGYYYITTTQGTAVVADTITASVAISDKIVKPTIDKDVDDSDVHYGQEVTYTTAITINGNLKDVVLTDLFPAGVTYKTGSVKLFTSDPRTGSPTAVSASGHYTLDETATSTYTFKMSFADSYIATFNKADADGAGTASTLYIQYKGTINENAVTGAATNANENVATLTWGPNMSSHKISDPANVNTAKIEMTKVDASNANTPMSGVTFNVKKGSNTLNFTKIGDVYYPVTTGGSADLVTGTNGKIILKGLDAGTYEWIETVPAGYNPPTSNPSRTITVGQEDSFTIQNTKGQQLPATGGIGTVIFLSIGGIAVLVAGVFLLSNKRMSKEDF